MFLWRNLKAADIVAAFRAVQDAPTALAQPSKAAAPEAPKTPQPTPAPVPAQS